MAGVNLVPYRGQPTVLTDLIGRPQDHFEDGEAGRGSQRRVVQPAVNEVFEISRLAKVQPHSIGRTPFLRRRVAFMPPTRSGAEVVIVIPHWTWPGSPGAFSSPVP